MGIDPADIRRSDVRWRPAWRIVPSRFPPVGPWDRIADPADFAALAALEGFTNPRLREAAAGLRTIPANRWVSGPGTTPVMAAFAHINPEGSRFSDGSYGVFYAARELQTAVRETVFHRERFLARTREPAQQVQMRCYRTSIQASLHDLRGGYPSLHDPQDYTASRQVGAALRAAQADGLVYDSVRHAGGECAAVFWPDRVGRCRQARHLAYHWDGRAISAVVELSALHC
jgi:hypothetical protein